MLLENDHTFYQIIYVLVLDLVWLWAEIYNFIIICSIKLCMPWFWIWFGFEQILMLSTDPDLKFEREPESERKRRTQLNHQTLITTLEEKLINGWVNKSQKSWNLALISQHPTLRVIIINLWAEILEVCKKIQHSFDLTFEQEPESKFGITKTNRSKPFLSV